MILVGSLKYVSHLKLRELIIFFFSLLATTSADQTCKIWRTSDFSLQEVNPVHELTCETQR